MTDHLDPFRRAAKALRKSHLMGDHQAVARLRAHPPRSELSELKHADYLHVIALENSFASWPQLKLAVETQGMDRAQKQQRLKIALFHGQGWVVDTLMQETPDLAEGLFGLQVAMYDVDAVRSALWDDPTLATKMAGPRTPMLHLAFSKMIHQWPDRRDAMIDIADMLLKAGADVNDATPATPEQGGALSALYGAIGHANNMVLGQWLLDHGANPNDKESLYHATELGHHDGLAMLLAHGADPAGTNALYRAMDFNDHVAVDMLLKAGARADDFNGEPQGGEAPHVFPALHQAARRMNDGAMIDLLLAAGADPRAMFKGVTVYSAACVYGNADLVDRLTALGVTPALTDQEQILSAAAQQKPPGGFLDPAKMPTVYRDIIREILHLPGKDAHLRALVAAGAEWDKPDDQGLTPIQIAGWEGRPELVQYFLSLGPDLTHVNGYGGTLLSTIVHGSENCPERANRDHIECARIVLDHGVALPKRMGDLAGMPEMAAFLIDWAAAHPGQVVAG